VESGPRAAAIGKNYGFCAARRLKLLCKGKGISLAKPMRYRVMSEKSKSKVNTTKAAQDKDAKTTQAPVKDLGAISAEKIKGGPWRPRLPGGGSRSTS
jgi:hypothetical protein